jgi:hypothetical protein
MTTEQLMAEQFTGCLGAGDYQLWAKKHGYPRVAAVDWTSSSGDWEFLVSRDGWAWHPMTQTNNHPEAGFTRQVNTRIQVLGNEKEAVSEYLNLNWS